MATVQTKIKILGFEFQLIKNIRNGFFHRDLIRRVAKFSIEKRKEVIKHDYIFVWWDKGTPIISYWFKDGGAGGPSKQYSALQLYIKTKVPSRVAGYLLEKQPPKYRIE